MSTILVTGANGFVGGHVVPAVLGAGLVAGTAELVHLPFPVATGQLRQLRLDDIGPLGLVAARFLFEPRPMEGALGYPKLKPRDQLTLPGLDAGPPADPRPGTRGHG